MNLETCVEAVIADAVQALIDDGWRHTHEGPDGVGELSDEDLERIVMVVLRSAVQPDSAGVAR
jgi:hypothetical protein